MFFFMLPSNDIFGKNISLAYTYKSSNQAGGCIHAYNSNFYCGGGDFFSLGIILQCIDSAIEVHSLYNASIK